MNPLAVAAQRMASLNAAALPHLADIQTVSVTAGSGGTHLTSYVIVASAVPCRLSAILQSEPIVASEESPQADWRVTFAAGTAVSAGQRLVVSGVDPVGDAFSRTLDVIGVDAPQSYETMRRARCIEIFDNRVAIATVVVSPATASPAIGATQQFTATPKDSGGNPITGRAVQWLVGDPAKASITADGLLTALASGTVDVLAIIDGVVGTAVVTVGLAPGVQKVTVSPTSGTVPAYGSLSFAVAPLDASGNIVQGRTVVAVSSDPAIASVSIADYVVTVSDATAAGLGGEGGAVTLTVTVDGVDSPAVAVTIDVDPLGAGNTPLIAALGVTPRVFREVRRNLTVAAGSASALADIKGDGTYGQALAQATTTKQPLWDGTTLNFDSVDDCLIAAGVTPGLTLAQDMTFVLIAAISDSLGKVGWAIGTPASGNPHLYVPLVSGAHTLEASYSGNGIADSGVPPDGTTIRCILVSIVGATGNVTIEVMGDAAVTDTSTLAAAVGDLMDVLNGTTSGLACVGMKFRAQLAFPGIYSAAQKTSIFAYAQARHNAVLTA